LCEWFVNDTRGLEHGFTIRERPAGENTGAPLQFDLGVRGSLAAEVGADGLGVAFRDASGATVLNYTGLKVWDADGKTLAARFAPTVPSATGSLQLLVEERGARYPVTVDPIVQQAYLKASNTGGGDLFGLSVAVSGNTVVVGAPREAGSGTGVNAPDNNLAGGAGAAYVFVRSGTTWSQQAYLKASNTGAEDEFGWAVAISGDTIVVGARFEDGNGRGVDPPDNNLVPEAGAAYVFVRSGTTWSQQAYLKASNTGLGADEGDRFGSSVAISDDTVLIGAPSEDGSGTGVDPMDNDLLNRAGAAYVFVRSGTSWSQQAYLKASNTGVADQFGCSVAVHGDTVVVGAFDERGSGMGINPPDDDAAFGAGAAYVFVRSGTTWSQQAYLKGSNTNGNDHFGANDEFGFSVAVSGDTVVVGARLEGVNVLNDSLSRPSGAVYVFTRSGTTWSQQAHLQASNGGVRDDFGWSVAVDGNTLIVGAFSEDGSGAGVDPMHNDAASNAGAAYVFLRSGTTWSQQAYLKASNTDGHDHFGGSVAVSGDIVLVGAGDESGSGSGINPVDDDFASSAGAAYIFLLNAPTPGTNPPTIQCPSNLVVVVECAHPLGTPVNFAVSATDDRGTNVTVTCHPPSGSVFRTGWTMVNCTAEDEVGNRSNCSFTVPVEERNRLGDLMFFDDFTGAMDPAWENRHADPAYLTVGPSNLDVRIPAGDLYQTQTGYKNLFLLVPPAADFAFTMKFNSFRPTENFAQIGPILYLDDDNYTRASYIYWNENGGRGWNSLSERGGTAFFVSGPLDLNTNSFFLRLEKTGQRCQAYYSLDGATFLSLGPEWVLPPGPGFKVGFVGVGGLTENQHADLDWVKIHKLGACCPEPDCIVDTGDAEILFRDDFTGSLDPAWTIDHEDAISYSINQESLTLRSRIGDFYQQLTDYKNFFRIPAPTNDNFDFTVKVLRWVPRHNYQQFTLLAYKDDDNHVRAGSEWSDGAGRTVQSLHEWSARPTIHDTPRDFGSNSFYLRLRKIGTRYQAYSSTDGVRFCKFGPRWDFDAGPGLQLGFACFADLANESNPAELDWAQVTQVPDDRKTGLRFRGLRHMPLGDAALCVGANGLQVANLGGGDGMKGVRIDLGRVEGWAARLSGYTLDGADSNFTSLAFTAQGRVNAIAGASLVGVRFEKGNGMVNAFLDPDPSSWLQPNSMVRVEIYSSETLVDTFSVPAMTTDLGTFSSDFAPPGVSIVAEQGHDAFMDYTDDGFFTYTPPGGGAGVMGNRVRVVLEGSAGMVDSISSVALEGTNNLLDKASPKLIIVSEAVRQFRTWHQFVGDAGLNTDDDPNAPPALAAGNIGSSMEGGVEVFTRAPFDLPFLSRNEPPALRVQVDAEPAWVGSSEFQPGSLMHFTSNGRLEGSTHPTAQLSALSLRVTDNKMKVDIAFEREVTEVQVDAFDGIELVDSRRLPEGGVGSFSTSGFQCFLSAVVGFYVNDGTTTCWRVSFTGRVTFTPAMGSPLTGTLFRFAAVNPQGKVQGLDSLLVRAANVEAFTIKAATGESQTAPQLGILSFTAGSAVTFTFPSQVGVIYRVEKSDTLSPPSWTLLGEFGDGGGGNLTVTDENPSPTGRFYRVIAE
jgi:regulation of enolase protein 1 (concanavalin A-like superfamily)